RVSGHDVPQLITVPSPQQDISRSHLELRLEGWHVVALDMGTTNGTTLLRPGMEPVRLRTREGVVLTVGDQIDLGDGIQLLLKEAVWAPGRPRHHLSCRVTSTRSCSVPAASPTSSSTGSSARSDEWPSRCCCRPSMTTPCTASSRRRPTSWRPCRPTPRSSPS